MRGATDSGRAGVWTAITLAIVFANCALAQKGSVDGAVVNQDGLPIRNATVYISRIDSPGHYKCNTNAAGRFHYGGLPFGSYAVSAVGPKGVPTAQTSYQVGSPGSEPVKLVVSGSSDPRAGKALKSIPVVAGIKLMDGSTISLTSPSFILGDRLRLYMNNGTNYHLEYVRVNCIMYTSITDNTILSTFTMFVENIPPGGRILMDSSLTYAGRIIVIDSIEYEIGTHFETYRFKPGEAKRITVGWGNAKLVD